MEQYAFKNVNNCWNTKITFYLETYGGENSILYLKAYLYLSPILH